MFMRNLEKIVNKEFLESDEYAEIMTLHLEKDENRFKLADNSKNFTYRAAHLKSYGAWRWLSLFQYRHFLVDLIFSDKEGIDFGGQGSPIGGNTRIVDKDRRRYLTLDDLRDNSLDYIYSSHTLEHIDNLDETIKKLYNKLKNHGELVIIVPCYKCVRWRKGNTKSHLWTFSLEDNGYTRIDEMIKDAGFYILMAKYCWDDSIIIVGEKPA